MSSPCTMNKLIRWRVRDWASCFVACRCSLGEEEADKLRSSSPEAAARKLVFDVDEDKENMQQVGPNIKRTKDEEKRKTKKKRAPPNHQSGSGKRVSAVPLMEGEGDEPEDSCPSHHHRDEDFIVFSFREGGQFDIVNGHEDVEALVESRSSDSATSPDICHVDVKDICCVQVEEMGSQNSKSNVEREEVNIDIDVCPNVMEDIEIAPSDEVLEEDGEYLEAKSPPRTPPKSQNFNEQDSENSGAVSAGSNDGSNKSDGSTGSFSFPVLPWELLGSPVEMPRVGSFQMRKNKAGRFQCCRF